MSRTLASALQSAVVPAVLTTVGLAAAYVPRNGIDLEAIEAAARRPDPRHAEGRGFRFPAPGAYPLQGKPWIKSRDDLIAFFTRGEDSDVVRRYSEGPEEELVEYLAEVFARPGRPYPCGTPVPAPPGLALATPAR